MIQTIQTRKLSAPQLKVQKNKEGNLILIIFSLNTSEYISVCSNDLVDFLGDGYCDDEANTEACLYDMGDCCDFNSISQSLFFMHRMLLLWGSATHYLVY